MTPPLDKGSPPRFVGLYPWLPWPLSAWRWWTVPVRAERLAVLRIGLALVLLADLLLTYRHYVVNFFGSGGLGGPEITGNYGEAPRLWWSIFRGFHDPLVMFLALSFVLALTGYLALDLLGRMRQAAALDDGRRRLWPIVLWLTAGVVLILGVWARDLGDFQKAEAAQKKAVAALPADAGDDGQRQKIADEAPNPIVKITLDWQLTALTWLAPLGLFLVGWFFWVLESLRIFVRAEKEGNVCWRTLRWWWSWTISWSIFFLLFVFGFIQRAWWLDTDADDQIRSWHPQLWQDFLLSWQKHPLLMQTAFWVWVAGVVALLLGWQTRCFAFLVWVLSSSFANLNPHIDNAGDTVRGIILFYLMLCPCGAAYSIDAWLARRRGWTGPVYVSPWPLRLLFVQMTLIYWFNGLYKITSKDWLEGDSLYLVLSDVTLTRFSHAQLDLPYPVTRIMTWTVLAWELSFPLLASNRWTRPPALIMGVMFHLGIYLTLELGGFAPYMLTLYLPFLPWERWLGAKNSAPSG